MGKKHQEHPISAHASEFRRNMGFFVAVEPTRWNPDILTKRPSEPLLTDLKKAYKTRGLPFPNKERCPKNSTGAVKRWMTTPALHILPSAVQEVTVETAAPDESTCTSVAPMEVAPTEASPSSEQSTVPANSMVYIMMPDGQLQQVELAPGVCLEGMGSLQLASDVPVAGPSPVPSSCPASSDVPVTPELASPPRKIARVDPSPGRPGSLPSAKEWGLKPSYLFQLVEYLWLPKSLGALRIRLLCSLNKEPQGIYQIEVDARDSGQSGLPMDQSTRQLMERSLRRQVKLLGEDQPEVCHLLSGVTGVNPSQFRRLSLLTKETGKRLEALEYFSFLVRELPKGETLRELFLPVRLLQLGRVRDVGKQPEQRASRAEVFSLPPRVNR